MAESGPNIIVLDPESPKGKALAERLEREIEERKARVRERGGTSFDGFYIDADGKPRSLGEDD
jgi:hypothetical protein